MKLNLIVIDGEHYIRTTPAKALMQSTMVYEVVTRGAVFLTRLRDGRLTVFPGTALIDTVEADIPVYDLNVQASLFSSGNRK